MLHSIMGFLINKSTLVKEFAVERFLDLYKEMVDHRRFSLVSGA